MNIQIFCLFTLVILLLEFVQLPEAHKFVKPWKPYRPKPRWLPFLRRAKRPFKKWPRKYRRRPRWHPRRYTPKIRKDEEPFIIDIELPKNGKHHKHHPLKKKYRQWVHYTPQIVREEEEESDYDSSDTDQEGEKIKLGQGGKPKLRIRISREDNFGKLEFIDPKNVTRLDSTKRVKFTRNETKSPWTIAD